MIYYSMRLDLFTLRCNGRMLRLCAREVIERKEAVSKAEKREREKEKARRSGERYNTSYTHVARTRRPVSTVDVRDVIGAAVTARWRTRGKISGGTGDQTSRQS